MDWTLGVGCAPTDHAASKLLFAGLCLGFSSAPVAAASDPRSSVAQRTRLGYVGLPSDRRGIHVFVRDARLLRTISLVDVGSAYRRRLVATGFEHRSRGARTLIIYAAVRHDLSSC